MRLDGFAIPRGHPRAEIGQDGPCNTAFADRLPYDDAVQEDGVIILDAIHKPTNNLLGFIDGIAMGPGDLIALQACGQDFQEHVRKITGPCRFNAIDWLNTGNRIVLIGWRKLGKAGKRKLWTPRIQEFTLADF